MDTFESFNLLLSPSERLTLKHVAKGELFEREMEWLAVQRLKAWRRLNGVLCRLSRE
jgi:hypothetical protein